MLMCLMEEKPDLMAKDNAGRCGCGELGHKAIAKWWNEGMLESGFVTEYTNILCYW